MEITPSPEQTSADTYTLAIVILSLAQDDKLRAMTEQALHTLKNSSIPQDTQIIVVESNHQAPPYTVQGVQTVYLDPPFNFNRYMNHGIAITQSTYVALCNNDLLFSPDWMTEIHRTFQQNPDLHSISPACPDHHPEQGFPLNSGLYPGYRVWLEVAGWCLVFKREILSRTGKWDEQFYFWYADNDYAKTLEKHNFKHALLTSSHVQHLDKRTLRKQSSLKKFHLTYKSKARYQRKWENKSRLSTVISGTALYLDFIFTTYIRGIKQLPDDTQ